VGKQVVYLAIDRHVDDLSVTKGAQWTDTDLTVSAGAQPTARDGSVGLGYEWTAGGSDQVAYLDDARHAYELSRTTRGGKWARKGLTLPAGAPFAAAIRPLSGYEWVAGGSRQAAYKDQSGHVHEFSPTVGGHWADTDLTLQASVAPRFILTVVRL